MIFHEKNYEEKNLVQWDPLRVPRVPILGPTRGIFFSKLNGPGPLRSGGHSHTSFSTGEFLAAQRTLGSDVVYSSICCTTQIKNPITHPSYKWAQSHDYAVCYCN